MAEQKAKPAPQKTTPVKATATVAARKTTAIKRSAPAIKEVAASAPKKKVPARKPLAATANPVTGKKPMKPTAEERYRMVQTAAYFIAERSGFGGSSIEHWAAAELEIANRLGGLKR